eukprot:1161829-Pelagomonas_calceolata.AAC.17
MLCYTTVWCLHGPWARLKHHAVSCIPNQRASMEAPDQLRRGPFLWTGASLAAWGGALGASLKFLAPEFLPRACSGLTSCAHAAPGPEKQLQTTRLPLGLQNFSLHSLAFCTQNPGRHA